MVLHIRRTKFNTEFNFSLNMRPPKAMMKGKHFSSILFMKVKRWKVHFGTILFPEELYMLLHISRFNHLIGDEITVNQGQSQISLYFYKLLICGSQLGVGVLCREGGGDLLIDDKTISNTLPRLSDLSNLKW